MINVIHGGNVGSFDLLTLPAQNPINQHYIQSQLSNFSNSLTDIGRKFIETSQAIYEKVNNSDAIRIARAAVRMVKGMFDPNEIVELRTLDELRFAQPMMQRYIMAEPVLRELYHQQQCDGYSDTYVDIEPGRIGEDHYDWRRVMTGVTRDIVDEDGEETWIARNYYEDLHPEDRELYIEEKATIIGTWDLLKMFVEAGKDPSDPFASSET